jgi:hypothetical protein
MKKKGRCTNRHKLTWPKLDEGMKCQTKKWTNDLSTFLWAPAEQIGGTTGWPK